MRGLGLKDGLIAAAKADFISLTAFEPVLRLDGGQRSWCDSGLCLVNRLLPRPPGPP
jgi:hypothetical protein